MRIIYFGTPAFAVPALEALHGDDRFDIGLVVTQPDRAAGRGRAVEASPVARAARRLGLPLYQPASLHQAEARQPLATVGADLFVVAAYGLIFGRSTLAIPPRGCVNLHASLLPRYRGASPIQAAIVSGDARTGVTLMNMELGLDTGPMIAEIEAPILPDDTTASLSGRLAGLAAQLARDALPGYVSGEASIRPQPSAGASVTRLIAKADGWVDWSRPAEELDRHVRAMWPWPRAWTTLDGQQLQIHRAHVAPRRSADDAPGTLLVTDDTLVAVCATDALALDLVQIAGKGPAEGAAFGRGLRRTGIVLGGAGDPGPRPPLVTPATE